MRGGRLKEQVSGRQDLAIPFADGRLKRRNKLEGDSTGKNRIYSNKIGSCI